MSIFVRIKFAKIYLNLSMRNIYKVIAVAALALMPIMTLRAQSQAEIEMAKSMARSYGYSESEIEAMVKDKYSTSGTDAGTTAIPPAVNRNETATTVETMTPEVQGPTAVRDSLIEIYGHNIFQSPGLNFVPSYNIPTPANYRLAAGDEIVIDLWGATYNNYTFTISPEGSITIPNVGPVYLAGNTVENAEKRVREKFSTIYSGLSGDQPNTFLRLTIGRIRSFTINVVGDAVRPGYPSFAFYRILRHLSGRRTYRTGICPRYPRLQEQQAGGDPRCLRFHRQRRFFQKYPSGGQ